MAAFLFFKAPKEEKMKLKTLTKCAVLVALAAVLSYVKVYAAQRRLDNGRKHGADNLCGHDLRF